MEGTIWRYVYGEEEICKERISCYPKCSDGAYLFPRKHRGYIVTRYAYERLNALVDRTVYQGLLDRGITVHVLNMELMDNTPTGKLIRNIMLAFAEFERDMIVERAQGGK